MNKNVMFVAALLAAGSASAQTTDSHVYVGIEGAYASVSSISAPAGATVTSDKKDVAALRTLVGYQFNKNLGLELGYFATDDFKQSGVASGVSYDGKFDVKGVDLALIYKFTEGLPGFFVKGGVTHTKVSGAVNASAGGISASASDSESGTGYLFGLGYEFDFAKNWGARLGYTRYEKVGGESDNKLNFFSLGVNYKF